MRRSLLSPDGSAMVSVLMMAGATGALAALMYNMEMERMRAMMQKRLVTTRDHLRELADQYIADPVLLSSTVKHAGTAANRKFSLCYEGADPADLPTGCSSASECCEATTAADGEPFRLIDPADPNGLRLFGGTESDPARFDDQGLTCSGLSATCPIEVVTRFSAKCKAGAPKCKTAEQIRISYEIRQGNVMTEAKIRLGAVKGGFDLKVEGAASSNCPPAVLAFGSDSSFTVPEGCDKVMIKAWGAGGGPATNMRWDGDVDVIIPGGAGGFASAQVAVTPGETLAVLVGGGGNGGGGDGGGGSRSGKGGTNGGGLGTMNSCSGTRCGGGGGGGGFSAVKRNAELLVVAGGGGGGGSAYNGSSAQKYGLGLAGGGASGASGILYPTMHDWTMTVPGGGTQSQGGAGGYLKSRTSTYNVFFISQGKAGSALQGGDGAPVVYSRGGGGGGGGGYFGGGGGASSNSSAYCNWAGGGGSSYVAPTGTSSPVLIAGSGATPGNASDPHFAPGTAIGGVNPSGKGGPGRIVIVMPAE